MQDILIKNGLIVTADETFQRDLLIVNGVIARLGEAIKRPGAQVFDAGGRYVMPGGGGCAYAPEPDRGRKQGQ